jgi:GTPase SAR1 family protein
MIVYDITSRKSFENVEGWLAEAEANLGGPDPSHLAFLLIGHKSDLGKKREVLYEEGEYYAKYKKMKFLETSAITGDNVNVWFVYLSKA